MYIPVELVLFVTKVLSAVKEHVVNTEQRVDIAEYRSTSLVHSFLPWTVSLVVISVSIPNM